MILTAWRVLKTKYRETAFTGEGARKYGGRWNSPGRRMIYTSASASLAILEMLVHVGGSLLRSYDVIPIRFDDSFVADLNPSELPEDWQTYPAPFDLKRIGDKWLDSLSSCVLRVPSAIVLHEWNYLLNAQHSDFSAVDTSTTAGESFAVDHRLFDRG